jgi:hypothetical protein
MGQQSIYIKNRISLLNKINSDLLIDADNQYLKEHFLVGNGLDKEKLKHNLLMKYVLCTSNCEIIEEIYKQIKGE